MGLRFGKVFFSGETSLFWYPGSCSSSLVPCVGSIMKVDSRGESRLQNTLKLLLGGAGK